jgi:long-chain acyl-CoA synthetase
VVEKRSVGNIISYREGYEIAVRLSSALLKRGLIFEEKEAGLKLLGIYSRNVQEFYLMDLACLLYGITCVPLYDTLGPANLLYCLQHSNISTCLCGSTNAKALLKAESVANLQNIILYEPIEAAVEEELGKRFKIFHFWKLVEEERGEEAISHEQFKVDPEQCFTFSYTSGTTGPPKAAMLSQKNFLSFVAGHRVNMRHSTRHADDEVHLSILPMPHVYERIIVLYEIFIGSFIVYPSPHADPPPETSSNSRTISPLSAPRRSSPSPASTTA